MRDKKPNWNLSAIEPKKDEPKSFGGGIKIPDEKKETREEEITRWANALYPTMKDKEGNLHIKMYDTYDFNKGENVLIQAGREQMMKGNLHPYFTVHDIIVPKEVLDKIWK